MGDVLERIAYEREDVVIGEAIHDVTALSAPVNQAFGMEQLQSMGDGRGVLVGRLGDFADAELGLRQQLERPQAPHVAQRPEQPDGLRDLGVRELRRRRDSVLVRVAGPLVSFKHLNNSPSDRDRSSQRQHGKR